MDIEGRRYVTRNGLSVRTWPSIEAWLKYIDAKSRENS